MASSYKSTILFPIHLQQMPTVRTQITNSLLPVTTAVSLADPTRQSVMQTSTMFLAMPYIFRYINDRKKRRQKPFSDTYNIDKYLSVNSVLITQIKAICNQ